MSRLSKIIVIFLKIIVIGGLSLALLLYYLPSFLALSPSLRSKLGIRVSYILSHSLGMSVELDAISLGAWDRLYIDRLQLKDELGRPALYARRVEINTPILSLMFGRSEHIASAKLIEPKLFIDIDSLSGQSNWHHLLPRLNTSSSSRTSAQAISLDRIQLLGGQLTYLKGRDTLLHLNQINALLSLDIQESGSILGKLKGLSFASSLGFQLKQMQAQVLYNEGLMQIDSLSLKLPKSSLQVSKIALYPEAQAWNKLRYLGIEQLHLELNDIIPIIPSLHPLRNETLQLSTTLSNNRHRSICPSAYLRLGSELSLQTTIQLDSDSLGQIHSAKADIEQFSISPRAFRLMAELAQIPQENLPKQYTSIIDKLGRLQHQGQLSYHEKRLQVKGLWKNALGESDSELNLNWHKSGHKELSLHIISPQINYSQLNEELPIQAATRLVGHLHFNPDKTYPTGQVNLQLTALGQNVPFSLIEAEIQGMGEQYQVRLDGHSKLSPLSLKGHFTLRKEKLEQVQLTLQAERLPVRPLFQKIDSLTLKAKLEFLSLSSQQLKGTAQLDQFSFNLEGHPLNLSRTKAVFLRLGEQSSLALQAPGLKAQLRANTSIDTLLNQTLASLGAKLPIVHTLLHLPQRQGQAKADLHLQLDSLPYAIREVYHLPLLIKDPLRLEAKLDTKRQILHCQLQSEAFDLGSHRFRNCNVRLSDRALSLALDAYPHNTTQLIGARLNLSSEDGDRLKLNAYLGRDSLGTEQGRLNIDTEFRMGNGLLKSKLSDLEALIHIQPSRLRIYTDFWDIAPAYITYRNKALQVRGLALSAPQRRLSVEGRLGGGEGIGEDALDVQLENINLRYILEASGVDFTMLESDLTGHIRAKLKDEHLHAFAQVRSPHFYVNKRDAGAIDIGIDFSTKDLYMHLKGDVTKQHGGKTLVDGWIKPDQGAGMDLGFDAQGFDVSFVGSFMDDILSPLEGYATGKARLHGLFAQGVTVSGNPYIDRGRVGIKALGTQYSFGDTLHLEDEYIHLGGIRLYDDEGHSALLGGGIAHKQFGHIEIDLYANDIDGLKILHTQSPKLMPAFGRAYASGQASLRGTDTQLLLALDLESKEGTELTLDFNTMTAGRDEGLMRFVKLGEDLHTVDSLTHPMEVSPSIIDLDLRLNVNPLAKVNLYLGGDNNSALKARTEGMLHLSAPATGKPELYGTLALTEGEYLLNIQNLALKRFVLRPGGKLAFRGGLSEARLSNLKAAYTLSARLADLDESLANLSQRSNTPVHCMLDLSGELNKPQIKFDIELPGLDTELEKRVRALLDTEDAVTQQIISLIALGKFYTRDTDTRSSATTNGWTTVANSAINDHLSALLGHFGETLRLGTNIRTKTNELEDTDIELNFTSSWLNNRLFVTGNVGYHDNPYLKNQYLGEFDFEYKLNKSGSLRLKGYNRYNTMYQYLKQSLLIQGFGLLYKQRFDRFGDLFRRKSLKKNKHSESPSIE